MTALLALVVLVLAWAPPLAAEETRLFAAGELAAWTYPRGLVAVGPAGTRVRRFARTSNAVADMDQYALAAVGEHGTAEHRVWAPSRPAHAGRLADQNLGTWWQPEPTDPLSRWWVEIDLGRAVVASRIRLVFPDTAGARPFAFFSVYVSPGMPLLMSPTQLRFERVGRPVSNNTRSVVELDLRTFDEAGATGDYLVTGDTLDFDMVRFVRFEAAGKTPGAALAEIEVEEVGFNLGTRVTTEDRLERGQEVWGGRAWTSGGRDCANCGKAAAPEGIIDADLAGRFWAIEAGNRGVVDWRQFGNWWGVDLGSVFRIDRLVWVPLVADESPLLYGHEPAKQGQWWYTDFMVSDGTPSRRADPQVEGPYQYVLLTRLANGWPQRHTFDLQFPPRAARFVFWAKPFPQSEGAIVRAAQLFVFHAEGHPARVTLESGDIDLGGAFGVRRVEWDADTPAGTRIEVETQTGNGYQTVTRYFLVNGREVTREGWEAAKERQRGPVAQDTVRDASWSEWSLPHRYSGQEFQSPTPRRWLRLRVSLVSEDPQAMPSLRSLSLAMNSPVISGGLAGRVSPREAGLDALQEFRYVLRPLRPEPRDTGFDEVVIVIPPRAAAAEFVAARVAGRPVAAGAQWRGDSLRVHLPGAAVKRDSVEVVLRARLAQSPSVFDAFVANSGQEGDPQPVAPAAYGADQVFVPQATAAASFVQRLTCPAAFTPNGDGVGDLLHLGFTLVKTDRQPEVRICALDGTVVAGLPPVALAPRARYAWDGRGGDGRLVRPGIYILRIRVPTEARDERVERVVHVAY
ncbi:MAG: hypothetical protein AB1505_35035 [Candidatus Latescibacterota bacterium]